MLLRTARYRRKQQDEYAERKIDPREAHLLLLHASDLLFVSKVVGNEQGIALERRLHGKRNITSHNNHAQHGNVLQENCLCPGIVQAQETFVEAAGERLYHTG